MAGGACRIAVLLVFAAAARGQECHAYTHTCFARNGTSYRDDCALPLWASNLVTSVSNTTLAPNKAAFSASGGTGTNKTAAHDLTKRPPVGALPGLFAPLQWMWFGALPTNVTPEQQPLLANEKALLVRRQLSGTCTTGAVLTIAGSGSATFADGTGSAASFSFPTGVAYSSVGSTIAVADYGNHRVREICTGITPPTAAPTVATDVPTGAPTSAPTSPTASPTNTPTTSPSSSPTDDPTPRPTGAPTLPTHSPTSSPTDSPTPAPSHTPTSGAQATAIRAVHEEEAAQTEAETEARILKVGIGSCAVGFVVASAAAYCIWAKLKCCGMIPSGSHASKPYDPGQFVNARSAERAVTAAKLSKRSVV